MTGKMLSKALNGAEPRQSVREERRYSEMKNR